MLVSSWASALVEQNKSNDKTNFIFKTPILILLYNVCVFLSIKSLLFNLRENSSAPKLCLFKLWVVVDYEAFNKLV
jgi:hypothetical protein